jgi:hypothetical protein
MKDAEQWHDEGVENISATLHRVQIWEIAAIQLDALYEAQSLYVRAKNPAVWAERLDALIRKLERKTAAR